MPADKKLHKFLDAIFDSGEPEFMEATELILRIMLRGATCTQHMKRFPGTSEEAVQYLLLEKGSIRQRKGKDNV